MWQLRLRELVLAGGALATLGCTDSSGSSSGNIPCGNANPDPCICDRPASSAAYAAQCEQKLACEDAGGVVDSVTFDGSTPFSHCTVGGEDAGGDGAREDSGRADASKDDATGS